MIDCDKPTISRMSHFCYQTVHFKIESTPERKIIDEGDEISGVDFSLESGQRLSFPDQSWYGHTKGKIIDKLMEMGKLKPGRLLEIDEALPPCSGCTNIM
ncbi:MAG: hypothetical protein KDA78_15755, partial [Planctomycetaceae bacterium]|nr:hypothetical protein [Planctomycetaceae bacterium]